MDAISKALQIMELFLNSKENLSVQNVSKELNISYPTAHRIISILVKEGYLIQPVPRGKYEFHPTKFTEIIDIYRRILDIRMLATPYMNNLCKRVDEAVLLAIRRGWVAVHVGTFNKSKLLGATPETNISALYSTSVGKVFLAYFPEQELHEYLKYQGLPRRTPNTITDQDMLLKELEKVRTSGVAFCYQEDEIGINTVAAPVWGWDGKIAAAIAILCPSARTDNGRLLEMIQPLKEYAQILSKALGAKK